ncbi:MAG: hypothetical protein AAFY72_07015, partial [Cyanobacteria bacterium J06649_4]
EHQAKLKEQKLERTVEFLKIEIDQYRKENDSIRQNTHAVDQTVEDLKKDVAYWKKKYEATRQRELTIKTFLEATLEEFESFLTEPAEKEVFGLNDKDLSLNPEAQFIEQYNGDYLEFKEDFINIEQTENSLRKFLEGIGGAVELETNLKGKYWITKSEQIQKNQSNYYLVLRKDVQLSKGKFESAQACFDIRNEINPEFGFELVAPAIVRPIYGTNLWMLARKGSVWFKSSLRGENFRIGNKSKQIDANQEVRKENTKKHTGFQPHGNSPLEVQESSEYSLTPTEKTPNGVQTTAAQQEAEDSSEFSEWLSHYNDIDRASNQAKQFSACSSATILTVAQIYLEQHRSEPYAEPPVFGKSPRGSYWLIPGNASYYGFLVLNKENFSFNTSNYQSVTVCYDFNHFTPETLKGFKSRNYILNIYQIIYPARVIYLPDTSQWQLHSRGRLNFAEKTAAQ